MQEVDTLSQLEHGQCNIVSLLCTPSSLGLGEGRGECGGKGQTKGRNHQFAGANSHTLDTPFTNPKGANERCNMLVSIERKVKTISCF